MDYIQLQQEFTGELKKLDPDNIEKFDKARKEYFDKMMSVIKQLYHLNLTDIPVTKSQELYGDLKELWHPITLLGMMVHTFGFSYSSLQDILFTTLYNFQRLSGFCDLYDEASFAISSRIDSEIIYIDHNGYQWRIELWKGQYGIQTGCEIGLYWRKKDQKESDIEKIAGKIYACVPDNEMLPMSLELKNKTTDTIILKREKQKHWWLTGFLWGAFENPDNLLMNLSIEFPDSEMTESFTGALKKLGYSKITVVENSVSFCFDKPKSEQPATQEEFGPIVQIYNTFLVKLYNTVKKELGIETNDPNEIWDAIKKIDLKELFAVGNFEQLNEDYSLLAYFKEYLEAGLLKKHF